MVLGEGPLRQALESMHEELNLKSRVFLPEIVKNPEHYLRQASPFGNEFEIRRISQCRCGAIACGLPVVSTDFSGTLREIIHDGGNGALVAPGDEVGLKNAMNHLMGNEVERQRLAE